MAVIWMTFGFFDYKLEIFYKSAVEELSLALLFEKI